MKVCRFTVRLSVKTVGSKSRCDGNPKVDLAWCTASLIAISVRRVSWGTAAGQMTSENRLLFKGNAARAKMRQKEAAQKCMINTKKSCACGCITLRASLKASNPWIVPRAGAALTAIHDRAVINVSIIL